MDWNVFFTTATPFVIAVIGGLVAHWLTVWRDRRNKRREQRIQYLIEAYRFLAKGTHNPKLYDVADEVQSAISNIQLFGTEEQIELGRKFVVDLASNKTADIDELLNVLRDDLREELKLTKAPEKLYWLRIEPAKEIEKQALKVRSK